MNLRVLDLQSFDETFEVPDNFPVSDLRDFIHITFGYDVSSVTFFHKGAELPNDSSLTSTELGDLPLIVLLNSRIFPQKSYPKVDHAFRFFPSRYQEFSFTASFAEDVEPTSGRRSASPRRPDPPSRLDDENGWGLQGQPQLGLAAVHADLQARLAELRRSRERLMMAGERFRLLAEEQGMPAVQTSIEDLRAAYGVPDDVQLTRADFQALRRLEGSGVDRPTIAEIYLVCDRNEEVAQNCLMSME
jgi:hypothetical protein